jgi:hypothetical protein
MVVRSVVIIISCAVVEVVVDVSVSARLLGDAAGGVMMSTNESFWQTRESQQYKKGHINII